MGSVQKAEQQFSTVFLFVGLPSTKLIDSLPGNIYKGFLNSKYTTMTIISNYDPLTGTSVRLDFNIKSMLFTVTSFSPRHDGGVKKCLLTNQRDAEAQLNAWVKDPS